MTLLTVFYVLYIATAAASFAFLALIATTFLPMSKVKFKMQRGIIAYGLYGCLLASITHLVLFIWATYDLDRCNLLIKVGSAFWGVTNGMLYLFLFGKKKATDMNPSTYTLTDKFLLQVILSYPTVGAAFFAFMNKGEIITVGEDQFCTFQAPLVVTSVALAADTGFSMLLLYQFVKPVLEVYRFNQQAAKNSRKKLGATLKRNVVGCGVAMLSTFTNIVLIVIAEATHSPTIKGASLMSNAGDMLVNVMVLLWTLIKAWKWRETDKAMF